MLSIIISSYKPLNFSTLSKNVAETIGIEYEIIKIDNPGSMGICEAYNKGAERAQFDQYLFLHEDIIFHTDDWGINLVKHLKSPNTGIIGVAGGSYVPTCPSGWGTLCPYNHLSLIQNDSSNENPIRYTTKDLKTKVFGIDGVFLGVSKKTYLANPFNEKITGFHGYDLDFSLRIGKILDNYVVSDILLEHFSHGNPDQKWIENNIQIRKDLGHHFNDKKESHVETELFKTFLRTYLVNYGLTLKNIVKSLRFYPIRNIKFTDHLDLLKHIYAYYRFKKDYLIKYGKSE